jgi:DNA polymerase I-like protein with 3'-5' exonuclease and polymerase domains
LGVELYPGKTYEEIVGSEGKNPDWYSPSKSGMFGFLYGGDYTTWNKRLGIPEAQAKSAFDKWVSKYPGIGKSREAIHDDFCSMRQPGGIGTQVEWHNPKDYVETFLGFRRYFTLENQICKALFDLSSHLPKAWKDCKVKVVRRDREQLAGGALSSALYGAAFQIQAANMRAANNHLIQSAGATITKHVQRKIWDLQPCGVHDWLVAPMNIHDEILCVTRPDMVQIVSDVVAAAVDSFRPKVPLIGLKWNLEMANWAEKKGGAVTRHITYPENIALQKVAA